MVNFLCGRSLKCFIHISTFFSSQLLGSGALQFLSSYSVQDLIWLPNPFSPFNTSFSKFFFFHYWFLFCYGSFGTWLQKNFLQNFSRIIFTLKTTVFAFTHNICKVIVLYYSICCSMLHFIHRATLFFFLHIIFPCVCM